MPDPIKPLPLELWFEFASTYSYLSVMRAEDLSRRNNVPLIWCPFLLGPIFKANGWNTSPFVLNEAKGRYMWRDVERRSIKYGLQFKRPKIFPANGLSAARLMTAAQAEEWNGDFARSVFTSQFVDGADIAQVATLTMALKSVGVDAQQWIRLSSNSGIKAALRRRTQQALDIGIFGAPVFVVGGELFWGDDRLEDAIEWALSG